MKTTGCGSRGREAVERGADRERAGRAERRRVVVGGRRPAVAAVPGRQPPPAAVEIDQDLVRTARPAPGEAGGDRRPRHDRDVVLGRRAAEQDDDRRIGPGRSRAGHRALTPRPRPAGPVAERTRSRARGRPRAALGPRRRTWSARRRTSAACPCPVVDDEVGVLLGHAGAADPEALEAGLRRSGRRRTSPRRVAEDAAGATGCPSGWCAWRQRRMSSRRALISSGVGRREPEGRADDSRSRGASTPASRSAALEPAVAVGRPSSAGAARRLGAVGGQHARRFEDARDVGVVGARRWPRPRRRPCPGSPARTRGRSGPRAGSRSPRAPSAARPRRCSGRRRCVNPRPGPGSTRPRMPASAMTTLLPRPEHEVRQPARPREADEAAQLEGVVGHREQVGRAADAHRREPRERLVARRLDAEPALDVGPGGDRVEAGASAAHGPPRPARARAACDVASGRPPGGRLWRAAARRAPRRRRRRPAGRAPAAAAAIAAWRGRVVEDRRRVEQRSRVEVLVLDQHAPRRPRRGTGVGPLVARRVGVRHDDHRQAEGGRPRRASRSRPGRRPGRPRRARPASRRAGTDTAGSGRAGARGSPSRPASAAA